MVPPGWSQLLRQDEVWIYRFYGRRAEVSASSRRHPSVQSRHAEPVTSLPLARYSPVFRLCSACIPLVFRLYSACNRVLPSGATGVGGGTRPGDAFG